MNPQLSIASSCAGTGCQAQRQPGQPMHAPRSPGGARRHGRHQVARLLFDRQRVQLPLDEHSGLAGGQRASVVSAAAKARGAGDVLAAVRSRISGD